MIKSMTEGKISTILWQYSMPLLISVVFQQLYNIVDSAVAGKFIGVDALAAVGASYPITMIFLAIAYGCNGGCSIVISQFFGAKIFDKLKTAVYTSLISVVALAVILTVLGTIFCNSIMHMLNTPENIFSDSALYLRIYIFGLIFLLLYNICTGVFAAVGDTKTPLYFLIGSSVGNVIMDLVFVVVLKMGIAGVAWATFLCQGVASILALLTLIKRIKAIRTDGVVQKFSAPMLKRISIVAIPSILQQSFVSVGNLFVQSLVNSFGSNTIAAYAAAIKLNTFATTSVSTMANGVASFTAQNVGAGKIERVKESYRCGIIMLLIVAIPFSLIYVFFSNTLMNLFLGEEVENVKEVLSVGGTFLKVVAPFYAVVGIKMVSDGVLRGAGAMKLFMTTTFLDLILRVVLAFILSKPLGSTGIWMSWPVGWVVAAIVSVIFYKKGGWERVSIINKS